MLETALALQVRHLGHVPISSALREVRLLESRSAVAKPAGKRLRIVQGLGGAVRVGQRQGRGEEEVQGRLELHL